ncbi:hypothetical protein JNUCC1_01306 [Lentibacillus sp. JNUCC-1]|uniref:hypothetical protein n=1 Tax=Lentibacillus sp. JNUCC-1 TaxID=2654513 RepID=UPI0012E8A4E8|nr:hypothetical protein [Lentibacillus sp. JNUCC-1]MUV37500.1 hypothetical protein [Lentibacillus sp. JNUCC-1]
MDQQIHAYFRTEDDAESARARLETLRTADIQVEEMGEDAKTLTFFPIPVSGMTPGVAGTADPAEFPGMAEARPDQDGPMTQLLTASVDESDYAKAMNILRESGGHQKPDQ